MVNPIRASAREKPLSEDRYFDWTGGDFIIYGVGGWGMGR
jgi:hypothetical protein